MFFGRRAFYVANIVLLGDYVFAQLSINLALSLISFGFLIYCSPYISRLTNVVGFFTELGIFSIHCLSTSFEYDFDNETSDIIMWTAIALIFVVAGVNILDILRNQII